MKRFALLVILCTTLAVAQEQAPAAPPAAPPPQTNLVERAAAPTYSDIYCAGFITNQSFNAGNRIVGGLDTPERTQFAQGDVVFLDGGGYQEGGRLSVVRAVRDPNNNPAFVGQGAAIAALGQPYAELGRLRVTTLRGNTAIAVVEFSCNAMVPGDVVVPFQEKSPVPYQAATAFERFPAAAGSLTGRIVMAKEFDSVAATGHKVYLNAGADKGVKPGDYFRVVRSYDPARMEKVDALSYRLRTLEETQAAPVTVPSGRYAEMPRRAIGEVIVLAVTPTAATCMVTRSVESINVGDTVELEGGAKQ